METAFENAISIAKKARGAVRYHAAQNEFEDHGPTAKQIPDNTNVYQLQGGIYTAKHLVNGPDITGPDDTVWVKVMQLDGKTKHWTVIDHGNKIRYEAEGSWLPYNAKPSWTYAEMAHNLPLSNGVTGEIVQSAYRVNDHTEIDIRIDVKVNYPGNLAWVVLGQQDEKQFVKGKNIVGTGAVYNDRQQSTPAVINTTESGRIGILCDTAGTVVQGYIHYILEPDGEFWTKFTNFPI